MQHGSSSPSGDGSPAHSRSPSAAGISSARRTQNVAARAAAARLAQVMASQSSSAGADDDEYDSELPSSAAPPRYGVRQPPLGSNGSAALLGRTTRSPSPALGRNFMDPIPTPRSTSAGRTASATTRPTATIVPPVKAPLKTPSPIPALETPIDRGVPKRFSNDIGHLNSKEPGLKREGSTLQDELDMLQDENESILEKLRTAEERCKDAEDRAKELEKQVAALGEGVSLEARLLSRKEAALRQREAALKAAKETNGKDEEVALLKRELESAKEDAANTIEQLKEVESEAKALQSMTQRMILNQEEMEEVVLKRCWLARYWGLAVQYGIYPEIAISKHEHWSALAPLPLEVVLSAGQKAKEEPHKQGLDGHRRNKLVHDMSDIMGDSNIESMLSVEMGLRELATLKVEDAIVIALSHQRRPNAVRQYTSDFKSPGEAKYFDAMELSYQEAEDVSFKQAWLMYFWRRAKTHGVEDDIAEDRLQFWISRNAQPPTTHDAIDVERGLTELRKLAIEQQLWDASRQDADQNPPGTAES